VAIHLSQPLNQTTKEEVRRLYQKFESNLDQKDLDNIKKDLKKSLNTLKHSRRLILREIFAHIKSMDNILKKSDYKFPKLDKNERKLAAAVKYFMECDDVIPDYVTGIGYDDDAYCINHCYSILSRGMKDRMDDYVKAMFMHMTTDPSE